MRRAALIVLDGVGVGPAPDAAAYGDEGSDSLGNVARAVGGLDLPNLQRFGLGNLAVLPGVPPHEHPSAAWGVAQPVSAGKDSTTGHWELCGHVVRQPFPTYPEGFPDALLEEFSRRTGRGVLCNRAGSGTEVLGEFGAQQVETGAWIVYTSADSVFQVAAHEAVVPVRELYAACAVARELCREAHGVARVIARPFEGQAPDWRRTSRRKDFSLEPPGPTLLDRLAANHIPVVGVGKVDDLFAGRGVSSIHAPSNGDAYVMIEGALQGMRRGLLFANVIEFDQSWGHRNDVPGYLAGLRELDRAVPRLLRHVQPDDMVIFTADHGNDPTTPSTDHSREVVPVLVYGPGVRAVSIGIRRTLADVGQTMAEFLEVPPLEAGTSFLREVWSG
jgi:phosphopentomutase